MQNCAASYAERAVRGWCYLFHVVHDGEEATVEVDYAGRVVQAEGPGNRRNGAANWGRRVLSRWGKTFPADATAAPTSGWQEDDFEDFPF